jgi:hypothetical protein
VTDSTTLTGRKNSVLVSLFQIAIYISPSS